MAISKSTAQFLKDLTTLSELPTTKKFAAITLPEYPFDAQLLKQSTLYHRSRSEYIALGGRFSPRVSSMMRSLSAQDLFADQIDYSPTFSEMLWFMQHSNEVANPDAEVKALKQFNENSLFHEQNHRVIWHLLPRPEKGRARLRRYLNFAESLVVTLDLALGDQLGRKLSGPFERMNLIFRPAGQDRWHLKSKVIYRNYLLALFCTTYFALELIHQDDILKAVNYVLPGQKKLNSDAVRRGLELSHLFTKNTNPQWQNLNWKSAQKKLSKLHAKSNDEPFKIAEDPLDLNFEFVLVRSILDFFKF